MAISEQEFQAEKRHLSATYRILLEAERTSRDQLRTRLDEGSVEARAMLEELAFDYDNGTNLETYAEIEAMNKFVDSYNISIDQSTERLRKAQTLLRKPYFAKISLRFKPNEDPRDLYLGVTGFANDLHKQIIIDWRSPVAEVYYNQSMGPTSYQADDGRVIHADLVTRRQFEIVRDRLLSCFDTSVAIEDPLLLQCLARERSDKLADITATIQREQNEAIRHEDVPALIVNGVAGSGKTSVLLQRIAYLFFRERESLDPRNVFLITPNPVFRSYIDNVLPSMGERNPHIITWAELTEQLGLAGRTSSTADTAAALRAVDNALESFLLEDGDFQDIRVGTERVISGDQVRAIYRKLGRIPQGPHRSALVAEELHEKLEARIARMSKQERVQDELYDLSEEDMRRIFGHTLVIQDESELPGLARRMLEDRYAGVDDAIEDGAWLRIDRIGMRLLGRSSLSAEEWLYVKLAFAGGANREARYVMIDEVQDYTEAQLMMLARYFCNAHFLMLGDPNQAIRPGTATFATIRRVFADARGAENVHECLLNTSYRSTPEITTLFTSLMDNSGHAAVSSVQREGREPIIQAFEYEEAYRQALEDALESALGARDVTDATAPEPTEVQRLTAIITADKRSLKTMGRLLSASHDDIIVLDGSAPLPSCGIVMTTVASAKGLEFDEVIIPDAQATVYSENDIDRHKLYTAISRATQHVTVLSNGPLTPLLNDSLRTSLQ